MMDVQVLIVGGGGCGLTASILLSQLGIDSLLVSALPTTSTLPKAHVLNQRAMEIMNDAGIAEEVYRRGTPQEHMRATAWYAGFAGEREGAGRRLHLMEAWGAGYTNTDWLNASPFRSSNLPQIRLEPIMRKRAEELAPGRVRFHHELVDFQQDEERVVAGILDKDRGERYQIRAQYVLGCDGGRTLGRMLGVEMIGPTAILNEVSIHMTADLSKWARDPEVLIRWIWLATGQLAVLVPMGPDHWGPDSEEWVFHLNYPVSDHRDLDDAQIEVDMRKALGIGDHPIEIKKISRWSLEGVIASQFQFGRIFLLGDSAHRHPPTGGLGLTSAIHDAHNMCWKLAAVLRNGARPSLLETYEAERRPVVTNNVFRSVENGLNHNAIMDGLGITPREPADKNWETMSRLWSDRAEDAEFQRVAFRLFATQSMEFGEPNVEYGYDHVSTAVVDDGSPRPESLDPIRIYQPSTRPGRPLPHAWLTAYDGRRLSTIDLVKPGHFLLITGENGGAWCDAAKAITSELKIPLCAVRIGHLDGDYLDHRCQWLQRRGIDADGAILVRPDRCVAWRKSGSSADPRVELKHVMETILQLPNSGKKLERKGSGELAAY